jgi:L-rhamnose-H+ transport protein
MTLGVVLVVLSGAMAGSVLTPLRFMKRYRFENTWLVYTMAGTMVLPWSLAAATVPDLPGVYRQVPLPSLLLPPAFALCWGLASALSGMCINIIGVSLTYALVIGGGAAMGALIPLVYFSPEKMSSPSGLVVLLGVAVMVAGIALVGLAGRRKEILLERHASVAASGAPSQRPLFVRGAIMALTAGVLSAGLNFAFAFGQIVSVAAISQGASVTTSTYPLWALAMVGGAIPNLVIAVTGLARNRSWSLFAVAPSRDLVLSLVMGTFFIGSTVVYGLGALRMGTFGTSAGWGIMQVVQIVVGTATGYVLGEWAIPHRQPRRLMAAGVGVLIAASAIMAYGNYLSVPR